MPAGSDTLTRAELVEAVHGAVGLSKADAARMVEFVIDKICDALVAGEHVKLSGFGTFTLRDKRQRIGRNPKTGVEVPITPRRVVSFRASQAMRARVARAG